MNAKTVLFIANIMHRLNLISISIGYVIFLFQASPLLMVLATSIYLIMIFALEKIRQDISFIQKKNFWENIFYYEPKIPSSISSIKLIEQIGLYLISTILPFLLISFVFLSQGISIDLPNDNSSMENMIDKEE